MKLKLISIFVFCLACNTSFAQETYLDLLLNYTPTKFSYGKNNSKLKDFKDNVWGFQVGVSWQAGITKHFSLVPEFFWMMKGGRLNANHPLTGQKTKTKIHTLEMPVLARYHIGNAYINAGPSLAYNITGKIKMDGSENSPKVSERISFDGTDGSFKRWEAGLQFGAGYTFKLKKSRLLLDARYHYGLVNISHGSEIYNRYFVLNLLISKPWGHNPLAKRKYPRKKYLGYHSGRKYRRN